MSQLDNFINEQSEENGIEHRLFGSPGTGKTYSLMKFIEKFMKQGILDRVLISSFTKGAAKELIKRIDEKNTELFDGDDFTDTRNPNIGTLHSICYKALGGGIKITETKKHINGWNDKYPQWKVTNGTDTMDDLDEMPTSDDCGGAALLNRLNVMRSRQEPVESYPEDLKEFSDRWKDYKYESGTMDYTDLIYRCLRDVDHAPHKPEIGIYDEVQDCSKLQLALIAKWMKHMRYILKAGDDDQCLYRFSGASPEAFLFPPIPEKRIKVLDYSRRLPRKILQFSRRWIEQVAVRQPKEFTGKDEEGAVLSLPASYHYKNPKSIVDLADKYVRQGKTVMILATCSYMLQGVVRELTNAGMPFHNPYRVKRGDWSPLVRKDKIIRRMMSFLSYSLKDGAAACPWTTIDIALWAGAMKVKDGLVKRGAGALLEKWGKMEYPYDVSSAEALMEIFEEDEVIRLVTTEPDIDWWFNQLKSDMQDSAVYPMRILKQYGTDGLVEKPKIIVGTVHSVKGGEADVVILFQDLSRQGMLEWQGTQEQKDSIRRVMYVGATRAAETLILASPASSMCMRWDE